MKNRIKSIAIILLFSFLGVQLISVACTITNFCHQVAHNINAESSHHEHYHHHNHNDDHHHSTSQEDMEEDNCCIESATVFLQGIEAIPQEINHLPSATHFRVEINKGELLPTVLTKNILSVDIRPPPPSEQGVLKRILFQSFQL